jgi:pyroglutamyl-peptidase
MTIIVTGFGPFLSHPSNPTLEVLKRLPETLNNHTIIPVELPVEYDSCFLVLEPFIRKYNPEVVVLLGLASGSTTIRLERLAINRNDSKHSDNAGVRYTDQSIIKEGPLAYSSRLPLRAIEEHLLQNDIPVSISNTAGLYVCNNLFYSTMHYIENHHLSIQAGFVHVPDMEPANNASMALSTIVDAVIRTLQIIIDQKE